MTQKVANPRKTKMVENAAGAGRDAKVHAVCRGLASEEEGRGLGWGLDGGAGLASKGRPGWL